MSLGPPIRKAAEKPQPQDVQVSPFIWRRPDGTMYTKGMSPGNVPPRRKPTPDANERDDLDFGGACW